jgi:hypothetical protein
MIKKLDRRGIFYMALIKEADLVQHYTHAYLVQHYTHAICYSTGCWFGSKSKTFHTTGA